LLGIPAELRTQEEKETLDTILAVALPSLSDKSKEKRFRIYDEMSYEFHPEGVKVIREGSEATSIFILLTGSAQVVKDSKVIKMLTPGNEYGHIPSEHYFKNTKNIRENSVICKTDCDWIRIDYGKTIYNGKLLLNIKVGLILDDYYYTKHVHGVDSWEERIKYIESLKMLRHLKRKFKTNAVKKTVPIYLSPGSSITQTEGDYKYVYIIQSGKCIASKPLEFERDIKLENSTAAMGPWEFKSNTDDLDEMMKQVCIRYIPFVNLGPGDCFPGIPILSQPHNTSSFQDLSVLQDLPLREIKTQLKLQIQTDAIKLTCTDPSGCTLLRYLTQDFVPFMSFKGLETVQRTAGKLQIERKVLANMYLHSLGANVDQIRISLYSVPPDLMKAMRAHYNEKDIETPAATDTGDTFVWDDFVEKDFNTVHAVSNIRRSTVARKAMLNFD
jgi:hypothetical protein